MVLIKGCERLAVDPRCPAPIGSKEAHYGMIVGQGFTFAVAGLALWLGMAVELTGVMQSFSAGMGLFQVSATDVSTRSAVVLLFIPVALAASCILALRATRTDPTSTLRVG